MKIRDRIKELRRVKASELSPNPRNWRTHPEGQQDALRGILAEIGYADAILARELKDGTLDRVPCSVFVREMAGDTHRAVQSGGVTPNQALPI